MLATNQIPTNRADKIELLRLLEEKERRFDASKLQRHYGSFYPWQIKFCAGTKDFFESCLCAANQIGKCVSFQTLIETEHGPKRIGDVFGTELKVKTHPNNELRKVNAWVMKGPEECYRITLDDGSWVEVPLGHRILVGSDYLTVDELFQGLPESVFSLPPSIPVFSRLTHALDARHLIGRVGDSLNRYLVGHRLCGEQLLSGKDSVRVYSPSRGDVQPHTGHLSRLGDLVCKRIGNLCDRLFHPSSLGAAYLILDRFFSRLAPSFSCAYQLSNVNSQTHWQFLSKGYPDKQVPVSYHPVSTNLFEQPYLPPSFAVNKIVSVYSVGVKTLYDMEVDERHNYIAGGLVHHNTRVGTTIDAVHLTGEYPDDYPGHRFDFAPMCWGLGYSMEKTRDLLQNELFGAFTPQGGFSGGLIPKEKIHSYESAQGTVNAMRTVRVKHKLGVSIIQFWSYTQGQHAIMGDVVDWVHVDEEPKDQSIRPQLLTRTINGDRGKGGRIIYTFTPENGRTELVIQFSDTPTPEQLYLQVGWNDAPHMTEEKKKRLLAQYPEHQRKMRSEGEPMLGHGRIYDIADEFIECEPFEIPAHWLVIGGIDFGWDHPQAISKHVIDPDTDTFYTVNSWKQAKVSANDAFGATKSWIKDIPIAWPQDGLQHEKGKDVVMQQKENWILAGFKLLPQHATWQKGGVSVEAGLYEIADKQRKGTFKIFKGQPDLMAEHRQYHRDEKGKIVKVMDDLLDSGRYAYMMRRFAKRVGDIGNIVVPYRPKPVAAMGIRR